MLALTENITRVDLEIDGANVMVRMWKDKWDEGSLPFSMDYVHNISIERILFQCEDAGFTCEMCDPSHGRALRGEITRIDIMQISGKWQVLKFPRGWTGKTRPISKRELTDDEAKTAIQWCKQNRWSVREFPGGARAWKGEVKPVRDASTIMRIRRQIIANFERSEIDTRRQSDLAFDC